MTRGGAPWLVYAALVFTAVGWGGTFPAGKAAVASIPPMTVGFVRFALAGTILEIYVRVKGRGGEKVPPWPVFWSAASGIFGYSLFFFYGLKLSSAVEGSLIVPTNNPLVTTLLAAIVLGERLTSWEVGGLVVALAGAFEVVGGARAVGGVRGEHLVGNLLFAGCVIAWAAYAVVGKIAVRRASPLLVTTRAVQAGALMILPAALLEGGWRALPGAPPAAWWSIIFLALPATAIAYVWWYWGIERIGPARASLFVYLVPATGALSSHLVLGEPILANHLRGAALIAAGLLIANKDRLIPSKGEVRPSGGAP